MSDPAFRPAADPAQPTVVVNERDSGGSGGMWFIGVVLVLALIAGVFLFSRSQEGETSKDNAIAAAAGQVGNAAEKVGAAAETAAENVTPDSGKSN